jgi:hypothetical protein
LDTTVEEATKPLQSRLNEPLRADENPELLVQVRGIYQKLLDSMGNAIFLNGDLDFQDIYKKILVNLIDLGVVNRIRQSKTEYSEMSKGGE